MEINQWKTKQLDEVATFSSGGTPSKQEPNYWEGDYPWVSAKDMKSFSIKDAELKLTPQGFASAKIAQKGSVLVLVRGMTLLKDLPVGYVERDVAFNQDIKALVAKSGVSGLFLAYSLIANKNRILNLVNVAGHGTGRLDTTLLKEFSLDFPPLPEQCKIAEILGAWDEAISTLEKLITAKRKLKQGLMQQLLTGKKRFKEFEESEWELTSIGKIAKLTAGGTPDTNVFAYWNGDIPWMKSGDINLKRIRAVEGRITQIGLNNSSTKKIPPYSVLIALAGQGKTRGLVAINEIEVCTNQSIAAIMTAPKKLYFEYLFYNLEFRYQEIRGLSSGDGGRGGLNLKILSQIKINLPTFKEQEKIASVLSATDTEISIIEKKLAAYKQQKRGLMQQLLTGKTRVNVN